MDPTKAQTQAVFAHLKAQKANKVRDRALIQDHHLINSNASIVVPRIPLGQVSLSQSTSV